MNTTVLAALERGRPRPLPVYLSRVEAGFPSPADDYVEHALDLSEYCIEDEAATFFVHASGSSMVGAGILGVETSSWSAARARPKTRTS